MSKPHPIIGKRFPSELSRRELIKLAGVSTALSSFGGINLAKALGEPIPALNPSRLGRTHDLNTLSEWGPFSKLYYGITHIPDVRQGLSFELSLFPLPTQAACTLPSALGMSGIHPWEASSDVQFYTLRLETIWKDQFYTDLSFVSEDDSSRLIRLEIVNRTSEPKEVSLNSLARLSYPPLSEYTSEPASFYNVSLPPRAIWVHALDYDDLTFAKPRPTDNLVPDGRRRGEERERNTVEGSVLAQGFGKDAGDTLTYSVKLRDALDHSAMVWRFYMAEGNSLKFHLGGAVVKDFTFHGRRGFATVAVPLGKLNSGKLEFRLSSAGGSSISLNGFAIVDADQANLVEFIPVPWHPIPEIDITSVRNGSVLKYEDVTNYYGLVLGEPLRNDRLLKWCELDAAFGKQNDPRMRQRMTADPAQHRMGDTNAILVSAASRPFTVPAGSRRIIYGMVSTGSKERVQRSLAAFDPQSLDNERRYSEARATAFSVVSTPAGKPYRLGHQLMSALTLTNLVYPAYIQREYVRHYTCGRNWDSLYTWDSGFIGLGLLELDPRCAIDILNAYTTPPGAQSAFIFHGTPLPVQIFLFAELWNRTQSREVLEYFYPRVLQFYRFIAGRYGSSTTRPQKDQLIRTWDYFYNTGGWDDYPPQKYVHEKNLTATTAPVISTAYLIRCAKLLRLAAAALGNTENVAEFDADIAVLSDSLQRYSWDEVSGYFSYVLYDQSGKASGILRDDHGVNFNMGLDGTSPLNAGICTPAQEKLILDRIFSKSHLWTDIGITTVDQSAPYFNPNGYWNGCVWMAHQWFLWKTMFDLGRADLANRIAQTGLTTWKKDTDATYDCHEHFVVKSGKGDGWHQFTSLSDPVLAWFNSLYKPGSLTSGFEVWVEACAFSEDNQSLRATLKTDANRSGREFSVLACMDPIRRYRAFWNGKEVSSTALHDGLLQIQLPYEVSPGDLRINRL